MSTKKKAKPENGIVSAAVAQVQNDFRKLKELIGDEDTAHFFLEWLTNGRNARKAYKSLHPEVSDRVAAVLGSRVLMKVDKTEILAAYGLDHEAYLKQLKAGMNAKTGAILTKELKDGTKLTIDARRPDHKVRRMYHEVVGIVSGFESKKGDPVTQLNIAIVWQSMAKSAKDRGFVIKGEVANG